jgi:O-antigen/teichoic acid export membrane protein
LRDSAHQYGLTAGLAVAELLYLALLARALGPQRFGLLAVFLSAARICQGVTDLRVHEFVIRYAETARASGSASALMATLRRALRLDFASTVAGAALALVIVAAIPELIPGAAQQRGLAVLAIVSVAMTLAGRFWSIGVLRIFHRVDLQARIQLGGSFAKLTVTFLWFAYAAATIESAFIIAAICGAMAAAGLIAAAARVGNQHAEALATDEAGVDFWPGWRSFIAFTYGIGLLETAYRELDVQLVGWFGTLEQVSVYKLAKSFAGAVLQVVDPVVALLLPHFSTFVAEKRHAALRTFIGQVALGFAIAGLIVGIAAHVLSPWLLPLLVGKAYSAAIGAFRIIVWCLVATMPLLWTHALSLAIGRPQLYLGASIAGVAVLIVLTALLVPKFGASGAATAYGASLIAVAIVSFIVLRLKARDVLAQ